MSDEHQDPLDRWAELLAEIAMGLTPDIDDASGILFQASIIVALKDVTPMQHANALLTTAEDWYARVSAEAGRPHA